MNLYQTHNLKVVGSNPTPATKKSLENIEFSRAFSFCEIGELAIWQTIGKHFDSNGRRRVRRPGHELRECEAADRPPATCADAGLSPVGFTT